MAHRIATTFHVGFPRTTMYGQQDESRSMHIKSSALRSPRKLKKGVNKKWVKNLEASQLHKIFGAKAIEIKRLLFKVHSLMGSY